MNFSKQKDLKLGDPLIYLGLYNSQMIVCQTFSKGSLGQKLFNGFKDGRGIQNNSCMCSVYNDRHKPHIFLSLPQPKPARPFTALDYWWSWDLFRKDWRWRVEFSPLALTSKYSTSSLWSKVYSANKQVPAMHGFGDQSSRGMSWHFITATAGNTCSFFRRKADSPQLRWQAARQQKLHKVILQTLFL